MTDVKRLEKIKSGKPFTFADIIAIIVIILVAAGLIVYSLYRPQGKAVMVSHGGEAFYYPMDKDDLILVGGVEILIKDGTVKVKSSECSDKYCIHQGTISKVNEIIVCMPQDVIIKITGDDDIDVSTGQK